MKRFISASLVLSMVLAGAPACFAAEYVDNIGNPDCSVIANSKHLSRSGVNSIDPGVVAE